MIGFPAKPWLLWTGRVMSALPVLLLTFSAVMKLTSAPPVLEGFKHFGFPDGLHLPIGVVEALIVVVYLVPTGMMWTLEHAGWTVERVVPFSDLEWVERAWAPAVRRVFDGA